MALNEKLGSAVALVGRRIDAPDAENTRFPLRRMAQVGREVEITLRREHAGYLVCSAACGADLLALRAAVKLGVPHRIVLPFDRARFKAVSVLDRPGDWGELFDHLVDAAEVRGDLVVLNGTKNNPAAFAAANERILAEVQKSPLLRKVAIAVWEGRTRGMDDATAALLHEANRRGFEIVSVPTV